MKKYVRLTAIVFLVVASLSDGVWAFTNPALPACYVADTSLTQTIPGVYTRCYSYYNWYCDNRYLYCSINHSCCLVDGCPACCRTSRSLYPGEIAGVVTASIVGAATIVFILMCICNRFCKRKKTS